VALSSTARVIDFQLRHAGELVVYGAQRSYGLLDEAAFDRTDPAVLEFRGTLRTLMVRDGAFTGLAEDAKIVHDGVTYTIRDVGNARTDGLRALLVTVGFTPASIPFTAPTTPQQIVDAVNALNQGQIDGIFIEKINQTVLPNGDAGLASPGTNSSTGFWCTRWKDALNPNNGKDAIPDPTVNGGNGAPCSADGSNVVDGLHWPSATGYGTVVPETAVPPHPIVPAGAPASLYDLFLDRTKGREYVLISRVTSPVPILQIGPKSGGSATSYNGFDLFSQYALSSTGGPPASQRAVHGIRVGTFVDTTGVVSPAASRARLESRRFARDIIVWKHIWSDGSVTDLSLGGPRDVYLTPNIGGVAPTQANAGTNVVIMVNGRLNGAAGSSCTIGLRLHPEWDVWNDARANSAALAGDSYEDPFEGAQLHDGNSGATALPSTCLQHRYAFFGATAADMTYPCINWTLRDMDLSRRTRVAWQSGEYGNGGTIDENLYATKAAAAVNPKVHAGVYGPQISDNTGSDLPVGGNAFLATHAVQDGLRRSTRISGT
jgi:hypothetical protein